MKAENFAFWLQGFFEVARPQSINEEQTKMIQNQLALVFAHDIDPKMGDKPHQDKLNEIHNNDYWTGDQNRPRC